MEITRILVPIDFSEGSITAFRYATSLAMRLHGALELLHIVPEPTPQLWDVESAGTNFEALREEWVQQAEVHMQRFLAAHPAAGEPPRTVVRVGGAATEIVAEALNMKSDLIVMGSRGHGRLTTLLLGSVADRVVRSAACPVVTIPRLTTAADDIQTILVPTDFTDASDAALASAVALAQRLGAHLRLLAVVESPWARDVAYVPPPAEMIEEMRSRAEVALSRVVASLPAGLSIERVVRVGEPFDQIINVAEESRTDLIVMGTHARGLAGRLLLGSVAQKVLHAAPCPVMTVKDGRAQRLEAAPASIDTNMPFEAATSLSTHV